MLVSPLHPCGAGGQRAPQALSSKAEKKSAFVLIKKKIQGTLIYSAKVIRPLVMRSKVYAQNTFYYLFRNIFDMEGTNLRCSMFI